MNTTKVTLASVKADKANIELIEHLTGHNKQKSIYRAFVRPAVAKFAIEMETVLRENDHKTGWDEMDYTDIFSRIRDEFNEMKEVYDAYNSRPAPRTETEQYIRYLACTQQMREEAIDIANFCMFLCNNYPNYQEVDL